MFDHRKYSAFKPVPLTDRTWPDKTITQAPDWCSVDLRDGNQALVNPMSVEQKTRLFDLLVKLGFKEIEVGFPSASKPDFDFVRKLVDEKRIPDDVTIQVLTQAREELIKRTYEAMAGVKKAVIHVYNSTSTVQREQVFGQSCDGIKEIAVQGAKWVQQYAQQHPDTEWSFQYSPESFSGTEMDYAIEVCDAVIEQWQPESGRDIIINLPATVEMSTPNLFADQVEYFCRHLVNRKYVRVSLHTHNDRGCAVAAAELAVMAGADRVEGTLMGNGERTGNMDVITMGMNLYSQGVDPKLDFSNVMEIIEVVESCTEIPVSVRHPWAGELVYTAFSGSHQDAIRKSVNYHAEHKIEHWDVAYLPIDPRDIGREYEAVVRINSQSGKGGVALVLERDYDIELPKWMHFPLSRVVQGAAESSGLEVSPTNIERLYQENFVDVAEQWTLQDYDLHTEAHQVSAQFLVGGSNLAGEGAGALEALCDGLNSRYNCEMEVIQFDQRAICGGTDAKARACIALQINGTEYCAVAVAEDTTAATLQAMLTAFSRSGADSAKAA
ncbi:2-isopropylmalate synthase [Amphritea balenae]|uniref:2-isopropylmalate synthase n=1 Tax=Amphritea balenae TaxID=452629 RepID=A0A3P1STR0_9GAMM|nr:2-isopropylmalate synthase [Amphritea balenae]RRC99945.1 2-isopropylmalate synthase [Amphritea balenae]GGK75319.1 2-isopropylmalate synthase [Amphritea balenae]